MSRFVRLFIDSSFVSFFVSIDRRISKYISSFDGLIGCMAYPLIRFMIHDLRYVFLLYYDSRYNNYVCVPPHLQAP